MRSMPASNSRAARAGCVPALRAVTDSSPFQNLVIALIVLNTGMMALERYPMDPVLESHLELINVYLTIAFASEMVLKIMGEGVASYLRDSFNRFDGAVVVVSVLDLVATELHIDIGLNANVLRAFRLLRVFKLVRSWKNLRVVLQAMLSAVGQLSNLFLLLLLIIFIFALLGMSLFGDTYTPAKGFDEPPRYTISPQRCTWPMDLLLCSRVSDAMDLLTCSLLCSTPSLLCVSQGQL